MKRNTTIRDAASFDEMLIQPAETQVKPEDVQLKTRLTRGIDINMPIIAAGHGSVAERAMAIAIARLGGIGVIHGDMPIGRQVEEVRAVKRAEGEVVENPIFVAPDTSTAEALDLMTTYKISGLPVVDGASQKVVGIVTGRDLRFFTDYAQPVSAVMSKDVVTVKRGTSHDAARKLMHENRIEKLVIVDDNGRCAGLITVKDIEKLSRHPNATRDAKGNLRVGAAVGIGKEAFDRAGAMTDLGLDVLFVEAANAHARDVIGTVSRIRQQRASDIQIVAGNVSTPDAARSLIDAGADAIKVGIGGTACAAQRLVGVGTPQLTALIDVVEQCSMQNVPVILDGGVCCPADFAKAIAAGADSVAFGHLFAGADEAPGRVEWRKGQPVKLAGAAHGLHADPLHVSLRSDAGAAYTGGIAHAVHAFAAGLRMAMAYAGAKDIKSFHDSAVFIRDRK